MAAASPAPKAVVIFVLRPSSCNFIRECHYIPFVRTAPVPITNSRYCHLLLRYAALYLFVAASVSFCHELGLDYVSCSPFRVPIARLAAAQAALGRGASSQA